MEKECSTHTDFNFCSSLSSTFCLTPSLSPPFIYGSKEGQREKKRQKSEVFSAKTIYFINYTLQNKPKTYFLRRSRGLIQPVSSLEPTVPFYGSNSAKGYREIRGISCRWSPLVGHHILLRKNHLVSRARDTRARSLGFALFCFHNLHTRMLKRGIFQQEKRGKATFTEHPCLQTAANSQKCGKKPVKTSDIIGKMSEKKR